MTVPAAYRTGLEQARRRDRELAGLYLAHTTIGDPPADRAVAAIAQLPPGRAHDLLQRAIRPGRAHPPDAPPELRALLRSLPARPPLPASRADALAARRAFHRQSDLFIPAFFAATLRNASTLIARSFHATGRVTSGEAQRRIRHNTHHLYEIMLPGSLDPGADGWALSIRIRLVHAFVRRTLRRSGHWDESLYATPLSAAHLALASANFSASILRDAARLGAVLSPPARRGYMRIWHHASTLIGVPDALLFDADERRTRRFLAVAHLCEPAPDFRSAEICRALVNAVPHIAGDSGPDAREALVQRTFRVSRALLGDRLADALGFPSAPTLGLLAGMRARRRLRAALHRLSPSLADSRQAERTAFLLERAVLPGFDFRPPAAHPTEETSPR